MARADLTGDRIQLVFASDASGKGFEEFVRRLLETERERRHVPGTTQVSGPSKSGVGDGGKDCIVNVCDEPKIPRAEFEGPLTWDELGTTYYSLKTGANWEPSVLKDVGYVGTELTGKSPTKPTPVKAPRSSELLAHIAGGNRYVVVTSEPADDGAKTLEKIIEALDYHMQKKGLTPPAQWREKINFLSANELAFFVRRHYPNLPSELDEAFGLVWPDGLARGQQWTQRLGRDRPNYVPDAKRSEIIETLNNPQTPRVVRIFGPPGVGKTRLIHHALEPTEQSVYYTQNLDVADRVVTSRWIERDAGAVTLVVDELTSTEADSLTRDFMAHAPKDRGARLVLIGVSDEDAREGLDRSGALGIRLGDLDTAATRKLVETALGSETGAREEQVGRVLDLADGYPWFAVLLARALAKDDDALASGDDEASRWDAAKLVLAGSRSEYGGDKVKWQTQATVRALCLLVVIMAGDHDLTWDELWSRHGDELRGVLPDTVDWKRVKGAEADCIAREILRHVGRSNKRYVSPANLARMILNHFFGDGPHDLGPRLARHGARFHARVHAQAKRLASETVRDKLNRTLLSELDRRCVGGESLAGLLDRHDALYDVAEQHPELAAKTFSAAIRAHDRELDQLGGQKQLRHSLRGLFLDLVSAPVSAAAFAELEDALFRMARVEDERWANNATGIWRSLFLVALSQTHQPWRIRFGLLTQRCTRGSTSERRLALAGLALTVRADERGLGHAPGRSWPSPSEGEYRERKREAWVLLLELCADTTDSVAGQAREAVAAELRGCVMQDVAVDAALIRELSEQLGVWTVAQRRALGETLANIRRYDYDELSAELRAALVELEQRSSPADFHERLLAQIGSWHPGSLAINDPQRPEYEASEDEALAREALGHPEQLVAQWPWLSSSAARRQRPFLRTLGRVDITRLFLPALEAFTSEGSTAATRLLAWYVAGWSVAQDRADADAWIAAQLAGGPCEDAAGFVLPFLEPSDERLTQLIARVEQGRAEPAEMSAVFRGWVAGTSPSLMLRLIHAIVTQPELVPVGVSLARELLELELDEALREQALGAATELLRAATERRLPAVHEHDWERLAVAVASAGKVEAAVEAALLMLRADNTNTLVIKPLFHKLFEAGHAPRIWAQASSLLEHEPAAGLAWHLAQLGIVRRIDADLILAWVGRDEGRAVTAMQLVSPYGSVLPDLARELVRRFGAEGSVASALAARVRTLPGRVADALEFQRRQANNAELWSTDELAEVQRWATALATQLREAIAEAEVHEAFRRKLG